MSGYDVAVIGAGLNGLTAAAYLAKSGKRVVVLEQQAAAGGAAQIMHDVGWLPPQVIRDLELEAHGLRHGDPNATILSPTADGGWLRLPATVAGAVAALREHSLRDAEMWPAFVDRIMRLAGFLQTLYEAPAPRPQPRSMPDLLTLARTGRTLRALGKRDMIELLRTVPMSVAELLDDWFELDALKGAIGAGGIRDLMQGPRGGGTAFVLLHHQVGRAAGTWRGSRHTNESVIAALLAAARKHGVEIRTDTPVAGVRIDRGTANGVMLSDGGEISAGIVISSADPRHTFLGLVDPLYLDPDFVHAIGSIKFRGVAARVDLALSEAPRTGAADPDNVVISISPSLDYLERAFDDSKYGRVSKDPYIEARVTRTESGYGLSAHVQYTPYKLRDGGWDAAQREALTETVVRVLDSYLPNFRQTVTASAVITPPDLEKSYGMTQGNLDHGELTLDQILFMRPVAGWAEYGTPIRSLYLCGAGTHPGRRVAGGAGRLAARAILES